MKGIIFTELVEMVEATFSPELMDELMEEADYLLRVFIPRLVPMTIPRF